RVRRIIIAGRVLAVFGAQLRRGGKADMQAWDFTDYPAPQGLYMDEQYQFAALGHNDQNMVAIIGDSHAHQYQQSVAKLLQSRSASSELPKVIFVNYLSPSDFARIESATAKIEKDQTIKTVILSEYWAIKRGSDKINYAIRCCGAGLMQTLGEGHRVAPFTDSQNDAANKSLESEIAALKKTGKKVYVILDNPFGEELAPRSLLDRSLFRKIEITVVPLSKKDAIERDEPTRSSIIKVAHDAGAVIIDPFEYLCDQDTCPALSADGSPIYKDYDHLSLYAVTHMVHYLDFIAGDTRAADGGTPPSEAVR
ncbi:MAG TPA: SGNH hydrolase domain-containing protein, partial [Stellaceae bacterium]|nr:SGNH hydrolase domain-containing protein [Stellaceae bacterium]